AREAVAFVDENKADLLILDVMMMDGIDGLTAAGQIKKKHPELKIILTTSTSETSWEEKARAAGVESFWYKEYDEHSLIDLMDRTMAGESVYPGDSPKVPFGKITREQLTERELEVIRELTASLTNEEIAENLHISANTVKRHIQNILEKTGFESRLKLAMNARALGIVVSESVRKKNEEEEGV
ncbi:MAG: LuxR C-terminal-related transcriptional regulator, partial [bacterium]